LVFVVEVTLHVIHVVLLEHIFGIGIWRIQLARPLVLLERVVIELIVGIEAGVSCVWLRRLRMR
jgi:hypothetical protein